MPYRPEVVDELNILLKFSQHSTQEGIKIHHSAAPSTIEAAQRLHAKGLVTQADGGYLTDRGIELAELAHGLINALDVAVETA